MTIDSSAATTPHPSTAPGAEPLLEVRGLGKRFPVTRDWLGRPTSFLSAVDGVDLDVRRGETVALVGESGCGKSTLARLILRLIPASEGTVHFDGVDIIAAKGANLRAFRRSAQLVFQDPYGSLDPRMKVEALVAEGMERTGMTKAEQRARVRELLDLVELSSEAVDRFPHEFSGGQRQRISIARALAVGPTFVIADEPVSALDVSVQSRILNLLADLQERLHLTYLFISHDMSVVRHVADRIAVMYLGKIVETGPAQEILENPLHPYTQALLSSVPTLSRRRFKKRIMLEGDVPSAVDPPQACRFAGRCFRAIDRCRSEVPPLEGVAGNPHQLVACFNYQPIAAVDEGRGDSGHDS